MRTDGSGRRAPAPARSGLVAALLTALTLLLGGSMPPALADTKAEIAQAKARLQTLEARIETQAGRIEVARARTEAQRSRLGLAQGEVNALATELGMEQARFDRLEQDIAAIRQRIEDELERFERLRDRLDLRARLAYQQGGLMGDFAYFFAAESVTDLSDAAEFIGYVARADTEMANAVQNQANTMRMRRADLAGLIAEQARVLGTLQAQKKELDEHFSQEQEILDRVAAQENEERSIAAGLLADKHEVEALIRQLEDRLKAEERRAAEAAAALAERATLSITGGGDTTPSGDGPLYRCPVAGPVAVSDDFGAPRVGHYHQGNDMFAAHGTPVVAPFPGVASDASNSLGGYSVYVRGSGGYIYGAHLSSFGTLGTVSTGTVIGYVGNTGNAQGTAYHLHFEWHPGSGGAVDPHGYLLEVC